MFNPIGQVFGNAKNRAIILRYHRVADLQTDPKMLAVTPSHFASHLGVIAEQFEPITLRDLGECMRDGSVPDRSVVVTFDGAYVDTLYETKALLTHFNIPATVFVTPTQLGEKREFWWDDLERLLLHANGLRDELNVTIRGKTYSWEIDKEVESFGTIRLIHESWNITDRHTPTQRHAAYRTLHDQLKNLSPHEQRDVLNQLNEAAGLPTEGRPSHRALDRVEIQELSQGNLIEIGASGMTHSRLTNLSLSQRYNEIFDSKAELESMIDRRVASFAYPYGRLSDYDETTVELIHDAGFEQACIADPGRVSSGRFTRRHVNQYELPRHDVGNWSANRFQHELNNMFTVQPSARRRAA